MFNIGEFSKIVGLTVKTLRFYHEQELLVPSFVDPQTGYRQYDASQIETARTIAQLRRLEFSLSDIKEILKLQGEGDILEIIVRQKAIVEGKIKHLRRARRFLDQFIAEERQATMVAQASGEVQEKTLDPVLIAAIRMKGKYSDCGTAFGKIGRNFGRHISGKPFLLHYDSEYKEDDADFEASCRFDRARPPMGYPFASLRAANASRSSTRVRTISSESRMPGFSPTSSRRVIAL